MFAAKKSVNMTSKTANLRGMALEMYEDDSETVLYDPSFLESFHKECKGSSEVQVMYEVETASMKNFDTVDEAVSALFLESDQLALESGSQNGFAISDPSDVDFEPTQQGSKGDESDLLQLDDTMENLMDNDMLNNVFSDVDCKAYTVVKQEVKEETRKEQEEVVVKSEPVPTFEAERVASLSDLRPELKTTIRGVRCRTGHWTLEEHSRFLVGLERFGPKSTTHNTCIRLGPGVAEVIAVVVGTRTASQVRSHAQKFFIRQRRSLLQQEDS
ncbi:hypothetical protein GUITHDRAFT_120426 [Guillardia theta CCMP2712]|uniref:Myb-like domain-containing protein n=1 Tax=Guillardia theta (strain CCMP2712) TaxID=905079 RepID=L1IAX6_GUITC|nr:hypothetical protein GUITHDRAFT_120426 [Guillardia theta CCMP2712]EKX33363.1 hypothetical protein GUITHDRAFT_120426 [Guillardia theta CCMP2712]|mmetsp:Transcript_42198/g.132927  ORF Transcript_42198/g.132927 Transcript_42198/m.132927 type:complete len:272 (-) Transcript_42198:176-991(-)|eukprot:XP_005820343.1 hypothetical protein GUITHDRAFT_120426 [Guillardia theta CCMP2712]